MTLQTGSPTDIDCVHALGATVFANKPVLQETASVVIHDAISDSCDHESHDFWQNSYDNSESESMSPRAKCILYLLSDLVLSVTLPVTKHDQTHNRFRYLLNVVKHAAHPGISFSLVLTHCQNRSFFLALLSSHILPWVSVPQS